MTYAATDAEAAILSLLALRRPDATICPSEAARIVDRVRWRDAMPAVHAAAHGLSAKGAVVLTQGGVVREPGDLVGVYRIRRP